MTFSLFLKNETQIIFSFECERKMGKCVQGMFLKRIKVQER